MSAVELAVVAAGVVDVGGDDGGLDAGEALHAPRGVGDLAADFAFERIAGGNPVFEGGELAVEVGGVFAGQDGVLGEQAVLESVFGRAGLAGGGAGSSGTFGVFAIGADWLLVAMASSLPGYGRGEGVTGGWIF